MTSIGVIGHFGGNKNFTDGQTVKTKEIYSFLKNNGYENIKKVDTYKITKNPIKKFLEIKKLMKNNVKIILIVSSRGYKILVPILCFFKKMYKNDLYDFVIGGSRQNIFKTNKKLKRKAFLFKKIYVETDEMVNEYSSLGFKNVEKMNNFKNLKKYDSKKYDKKIKEMHLCTFSRVCEEKGITDSIKAIVLANKNNSNIKYILDIYGNIEEQYKETFSKLLDDNKQYIKYCGTVDFDKSSDVITKYDCLLFLTFWKGEGFPGTLIDSFYAATPVIATDWNYNFEILEEEKTGIKVEVNDIKTTAEKINYLSENPKILEKMSKKCHEEVKKYLPENIMKPFLEELETE